MGVSNAGRSREHAAVVEAFLELFDDAQADAADIERYAHPLPRPQDQNATFAPNRVTGQEKPRPSCAGRCSGARSPRL